MFQGYSVTGVSDSRGSWAAVGAGSAGTSGTLWEPMVTAGKGDSCPDGPRPAASACPLPLPADALGGPLSCGGAQR